MTTEAEFLRWLLALLQGRWPADLAWYEVSQAPAGTGGAEAIEVAVDGRTFRIRVEAVD